MCTQGGMDAIGRKCWKLLVPPQVYAPMLVPLASRDPVLEAYLRARAQAAAMHAWAHGPAQALAQRDIGTRVNRPFQLPNVGLLELALFPSLLAHASICSGDMGITAVATESELAELL